MNDERFAITESHALKNPLPQGRLPGDHSRFPVHHLERLEGFERVAQRDLTAQSFLRCEVGPQYCQDLP